MLSFPPETANDRGNHPGRVFFMVPQKIFCAIITFLGGFRRVIFMSTSMPADHTNPTQYLFFGLNLMIGLYDLMRVRLIWLQNSKLLKILNMISSKPTATNSWLIKFVSSKKGRITFHILLLVLAAIVLQELTTINFSYLEEVGQRNFFSRNTTTGTIEKVIDVALGMGNFWNIVIGYYHETYMLLIALTMWLPVKIFAEELQSDIREMRQLPARSHGSEGPDISNVAEGNVYPTRCVSWCKVKEQYKFAVKLSGKVNGMYGSFVFCCILIAILYESISFGSLFIIQGLLESLRKVLFEILLLMMVCGALILAADARKQVCKLNSFVNLKTLKPNFIFQVTITFLCHYYSLDFYLDEYTKRLALLEHKNSKDSSTQAHLHDERN